LRFVSREREHGDDWKSSPCAGGVTAPPGALLFLESPSSCPSPSPVNHRPEPARRRRRPPAYPEQRGSPTGRCEVPGRRAVNRLRAALSGGQTLAPIDFAQKGRERPRKSIPTPIAPPTRPVLNPLPLVENETTSWRFPPAPGPEHPRTRRKAASIVPEAGIPRRLFLAAWRTAREGPYTEAVLLRVGFSAARRK
jgi:hypothetical protein